MHFFRRSVSGLVETCMSVYRPSSDPVVFLAIKGFTVDLTGHGKSTSACSRLGTWRELRFEINGGLGEEEVVGEEDLESI
jgi:hypothetical protein